MSDHFEKFADYIIGGDSSDIAKIKAERDYALHCLEREIAIAQSTQVQNVALVKALKEARQYVDDAMNTDDDPEVHRNSSALLIDIDAALAAYRKES